MKIYEIYFENDKSFFNKTTILVYMSETDLELRYVNTITNKIYKSWEKMALEEYKRRGLIKDKYKMYVNVIWKEKNE